MNNVSKMIAEEAERFWERRWIEANRRIEQLEAALREIADKAVRAALDQSSPPKATDCTCPVGMHSIGCHNR